MRRCRRILRLYNFWTK